MMLASVARNVTLTLLAAALAACATAGPADPATAPAKNSISWNTAKDHVGETLTVTGPVVSTHTTRDGSHISLNVGKDFPDPSRFSIYLPAEKGAADPDTLYKGKTVSVTGEIILYQDAPEIKAEPKDLHIAK